MYVFQKGNKYSIQLSDDPCDFDTYDEDGDGTITLEELIALFHFPGASRALYEDLNVISGS